jgi:hypothetical protein
MATLSPVAVHVAEARGETPGPGCSTQEPVATTAPATSFQVYVMVSQKLEGQQASTV